MATATARDIITRAARRINSLEGEEALTAAEAVDGLQILNDMLFAFGPMGIKYAHTALALTDVVNFPDEQLRNVTLMLCRELADDYGITMTPVLMEAIGQAKLELQAAFHIQPPGIIDPALLGNTVGGFDITRGE